MNVETLQTMSIIAYIIAGSALLLAILMFFLFNVPKIFNELTGRAERKFIAEAQKKNEVSETTSENSVSESLFSSGLHPPTVQTATTKLNVMQDRTGLTVNLMMQNTGSVDKTAEQKIPVVSPENGFSILEEFSFTSSAEIIE